VEAAHGLPSRVEDEEAIKIPANFTWKDSFRKRKHWVLARSIDIHLRHQVAAASIGGQSLRLDKRRDLLTGKLLSECICRKEEDFELGSKLFVPVSKLRVYSFG